MRKSTKCPYKIIAHSLVKYMAAIAGRALAPMFLHPRQYGGINLEKAYWRVQQLLNLAQQSLAQQSYSFNSSIIKWYSVVFPAKFFLSECFFVVFLLSSPLQWRSQPDNLVPLC
jgi:hypothetical protein